MSEKYNAFGRVHTVIGESSSDLLLKCAGKIKILWGNKFIDLIKDGKININSKVLYSIDSLESIGNKEGIYVTSLGDVYLKIGNNDLINLVGKVGTTYVSFLKEQTTNSDSKYTALRNIGFLYPTIEDITEDSLLNGIIYVESELNLYIVKDGALSKFTISFPNPFTEQFIIAKNDASTGSLVISGSGINNSLAFDSLYIFTEEGEACLAAELSVRITLLDKTYLTIDKQKTQVNNELEANTIQSIGATPSSGFMLYKTDTDTTLIVDNLIVRNGLGNSSVFLDPIEWSYGKNIITAIKSSIDENTNEITYAISLKYENLYKIDDQLYFYVDMPSGDNIRTIKIPVKIVALNPETTNVIYALIIKELANFIPETFLCVGRSISLVGTNQLITTVRLSEKAIDVVECLTILEEKNIASIISRLGNLTELNLKERNKVDGEVPIKGNGTYTKLGYFLLAGYVHDYKLPDDDDSTKFASTEWVNRKKTSSSKVDIDLTIYLDEDSLVISEYFSRPEILLLLQNQEVGTIVSYLGLYGVITISKSEKLLIFSAVVRAFTSTLRWSHRSINATYDSVYKTWLDASTYIIQDQFRPGYYWARGLENLKPVSPIYIGTTNTEIVSENRPYILYTNDGKVWKLIDEYIAPDKDLVYFSASGTATCDIPNSQTVPMGFIGIAKSDGTTLVNVGKSNYAIDTFNVDNFETGDIRGQIPKATRALLIKTLKDALSGIIPHIPGLPTSFYIRKEDISTIPENSIHKLKSSEGGLSPATIFLDAKVYVRNAILSLCRWTNSEGIKYNTTHPGTYKSVGDIDFWRNDLNIRILAGDILCEIFQSVQNISAKEARDVVYSDVVGFALTWMATHWENFDFFLMSGVCESSFAAPTDDEGNAKAGLRMNNSISIICDTTHIYGGFHVTYRDYKWPESPDSNYPYLSAVWAIDDITNVSEAYRLPYPVEILLSLVFDGINARYKIEGTVGSGLSISAA